jgi:hypothetical protein
MFLRYLCKQKELYLGNLMRVCILDRSTGRGRVPFQEFGASQENSSSMWTTGLFYCSSQIDENDCKWFSLAIYMFRTNRRTMNRISNPWFIPFDTLINFVYNFLIINNGLPVSIHTDFICRLPFQHLSRIKISNGGDQIKSNRKRALLLLLLCGWISSSHPSPRKKR